MACTENRRGAYGVLVRKPEELGPPGVDERIILKWTFMRRNVAGGVLTGSILLRIGTGSGRL